MLSPENTPTMFPHKLIPNSFMFSIYNPGRVEKSVIIPTITNIAISIKSIFPIIGKYFIQFLNLVALFTIWLLHQSQNFLFFLLVYLLLGLLLLFLHWYFLDLGPLFSPAFLWIWFKSIFDTSFKSS